MKTAKDFIIGGLLAGLFIISLISFGSGLGLNYGKPDLMKTDYINTTRISKQIEKSTSDANRWGEAFTSDNIFVSTGAIIIFSIWGVFKLIYTSVISIFIIYFDVIANTFGIPLIVTSALTSILIISLIFAGWKLIKQGE